MVTEDQVIGALKKCQDPEIRLDVWTLGLIYDLKLKQDIVNVKMTFTTPFCPFGETLIENIREEISKIEGVKDVQIEVTFEPPWKPSDEIKMLLGIPV